jgi:hypothetical protein
MDHTRRRGQPGHHHVFAVAVAFGVPLDTFVVRDQLDAEAAALAR